MKFPCVFQRAKPSGGGIKAFDTVTPATSSVPRDGISSDDNVFFIRTKNDVGSPVQRIIVACSTTGTSPVALNVGVFIFEKNLNLWIAVPGSATTMLPVVSPGNPAPVYFDLPAISDPNHTLNDLQNAGNGNMSVCVLVTDSGSAVNGTYTIVAAADMAVKSY